MHLRHPYFISRTVLVRNADPEQALRLLNRLCTRDGITEMYKRNERYEKPHRVRQRINLERCIALYNEDLKRKIDFLSRKNRKDPFPAC
ncbi:UNVERIFIED_CONTAM: hypothetical protein PYX00_002194 [Menopon gallinae]|uniref:Ribosomal protein S21 n=1 Tax=Menopon gallinae TaxID=328185 RepID=A0AAW2IFP4_9NEOP